MSFVVTVARPARIRQGLAAPVRSGRGLDPLERPDALGRDIRMVVAIVFGDDELNDRGIFIDTDLVEQYLDEEVARLESAPWTRMFPFRPSMELVCRDLFHRLLTRIDNLVYVEFDDLQLGVMTRYGPSLDRPGEPRPGDA
jgi:hypothetical protein